MVFSSGRHLRKGFRQPISFKHKTTKHLSYYTHLGEERCDLDLTDHGDTKRFVSFLERVRRRVGVGAD